MVKYKFQCFYCNHVWDREFYEIPSLDELRCPVCKDSNVKKFRIDEKDIFGYNIPRKKEKKNGKS